MADVNVMTLTVSWVDTLQTGKKPPIQDLAKLVFGLSASPVRLKNLGDYKDENQLDLDTKTTMCITLLTKFLLQNGLESLEELEETPLELVSVIYKSTDHVYYLPLFIVGALISVKNYLGLARVYPGLPPVLGMLRVTLEGYLSSWTSTK